MEQYILTQMKGPDAALSVCVPGMRKAGVNPFLSSGAGDQPVKNMAGYKGFSQQIHIQGVQIMQLLPDRKP
ncbi:hypothetical protein D3C80_1651350 [compost metagenome]